MKKINLLISVFSLFVLLATPTLASKRASVSWGEELYKSQTLGGSTNDKSCSSCHTKDDKKMLKKIMKMSKDERNSMINQCITGALQGEELDPKSEEMVALRLYLNFLTNDCL